jgi:hypothetical protein
MSADGTVYWADLQQALSQTGLDVSLGLPFQGGLWGGKIDGKTFCMTVAERNQKDGIRDFMLITLCGQEESSIIEKMSQFMGYQPFCRYQDRRTEGITSITLEWDRKDPEGRLGELAKEENTFELEKLEGGFLLPEKPSMEKFYNQFIPEVIEVWEEAVRQNEGAEWSGQRIAKLLPFIKKVMPFIGKNQSLFGLSIISLDGKQPNEEEIVRHGLKPLLDAQILSQNDGEKIVSWYARTEPTWHSDGGVTINCFIIDDVEYALRTDSYRNCRDLNLIVN